MKPISARRLIALVLLCFGLEAAAGETVVVKLSDEEAFGPLWREGSFEQGARAGFPWVRVVSDGRAHPSFVLNRRPYTPPIDCTGKFVKVWIKVEDISSLSGMEFRLSSDGFRSNHFAFSFPIYADEETNILQDRVWTTLTFSFGTAKRRGAPDRSSIDSVGWYVVDRGSGAPVTAYWGGLALVDESAEGVVSLTFDDGYDEHYAAAEIMAKFGFKGTAYVIPDAVGRQGHMTLQQLLDLRDRYAWDVAAHHVTPFTAIPPDELEDTLLGVKRYLADHGFENGAGHLAYPLGKQNSSVVRPLVRKHFRTARVTGAGPETLPPADPHLLRVFNVTNTTTPAEVGAAARRARENKEWLILMFHYLVDEPSFSTAYSLKDFRRILDELKRSQIRVLPVTEVWETCGRPAGSERCSFGAGLAAGAATP